jgi:hypothetical protein
MRNKIGQSNLGDQYALMRQSTTILRPMPAAAQGGDQARSSVKNLSR